MVALGNGQKWDRAAIPAGTKIGRYLVGEKIAEGGMAEVYRASALGDQGFSKEVVLKVVLPGLAHDDEFIDMFIAEARLASKLTHPNIVQIFDFGKHDGRYFIAMEYVHGVSLWRLRSRCRQLKLNFPPILAAAICADVAKALQHAHTLREDGRLLNVVHRDVTPHNVLLSVDGAVKLTDFGIAKAGTSHTRPGILKGKFPYMSPEQGRGEPVDARTDVFALGILIWELLAGKRLFVGDSDLEVLHAVQRAPIVSPRVFGAHIPEELAAVALKALARPLSERYQTAAELGGALTAFVMRTVKRVEDTSVADFLVATFPPQDEFMSPIQPSVPQHDAATEEAVPSGFAAVRTDPLPGIPPAPKRETPAPEPAAAPPANDRSTIPVLALFDHSAHTARMPGGRKEQAPPSSKSPRVLIGDAFPRLAGEAPPSGESLETLRGDAFPGWDGPLGPEEGGERVEPTARDATEGRPTSPVPAGPQTHARLAFGVILAIAGVCAVGGSLWRQRVPASSALEAPRPLVGAQPEASAPAATTPKATAPVLTDHEEAAHAAAGERAESLNLTRPVPTEATPASSTGRLTVYANPFARVTVRGRSFGQVSGTRSFRLAPGTYEVQLAHPLGQVVKTVTVRPGDESRVELDLSPQ